MRAKFSQSPLNSIAAHFPFPHQPALKRWMLTLPINPTSNTKPKTLYENVASTKNLNYYYTIYSYLLYFCTVYMFWGLSHTPAWSKHFAFSLSSFDIVIRETAFKRSIKPRRMIWYDMCGCEILCLAKLWNEVCGFSRDVCGVMRALLGGGGANDVCARFEVESFCYFANPTSF